MRPNGGRRPSSNSWNRRAARCCRGGTARVEMATARQIDRARDLALENKFRAPDFRVRHRNRRQEGAGVRVNRVFEELLRRAQLYDFAEIHDRYPVAEVPDCRQVMRDEKIGDPQTLLQIDEKIDDLRPRGWIERGDRLVQNDELRLCRNGPRDSNALLLPSGYLVRVPVGGLRGTAPPLRRRSRTRSSTFGFRKFRV